MCEETCTTDQAIIATSVCILFFSPEHDVDDALDGDRAEPSIFSGPPSKLLDSPPELHDEVKAERNLARDEYEPEQILLDALHLR